jgi:hypothetical protein
VSVTKCSSPGRRSTRPERWGCRIEGVEPESAGGLEGVADVRQLCIQDVAGARLKVVRLTELRYTTPDPALPCLARRFRDGSGIALEDGHVVAVACKE